MAKRRRKQIHCLNCDTPLKEPFNFCPECGQENNDNNIRFSTLFRDFWSNYFSFDSRFARTIRPFFTKPGAITLAFISGKRVRYANPVRFYLLLSFFHFFFFLRIVDSQKLEPISLSTTKSEGAIAQLDSLYSLPDSLKAIQDAKGGLLTIDQTKVMTDMIDDGSYSDEKILDSLGIGGKSSRDQFYISKLIKINRLSDVELNMVILPQIPIAMFFMLPFMALLLKLFYRKKLYILHLVHVIHLHCFAYFVLSLIWLYGWVIGTDVSVFAPFAFAICWIYTYVSLRKVYENGWMLTFVKFFTATFLYLLILMLGTVSTAGVTFLLL